MAGLRNKNAVTELGGLIMILSLAIMIFPMWDTTDRISLDLGTHPKGFYNKELDDERLILNYVLLGGDLCVIALGLLGIAIGFMTLTNGGMVCFTVLGLIWEQTSFIDWIGKMYNLKYVHPTYDSDTDEAFFFSMDILKMFFACFLLYGSLGLALFNLFAFQTGKGYTKNAGYYRGRLLFYSFMYTGHGLFPFLTQGTYIYLLKKDEGLESPLTPPVMVAGQPITHPEITIATGVLLTLIGMWGMLRGLGKGSKSRTFQVIIGFGYLAYICLIVLTEFSAAQPAAAKASMASAVFLNAHVIIAYLDEKASTTPEEMDKNYWESDEEIQPFMDDSEEIIEEEVVEPEGEA